MTDLEKEIRENIDNSAEVVGQAIGKDAKPIAFWKRFIGGNCTEKNVRKHSYFEFILVNWLASFKRWIFAFVMASKQGGELILIDIEIFVRLCYQFKRSRGDIPPFMNELERDARLKVLEWQYA